MATDLHFDVSSGLKSVLGSDLITDDEVAIFELVKNSFDAGAKQVDLYFGDRRIVIADNGVGMTYDDIRNKWLFVAYSSKRGKNRSNDFRDDIADRHHYAGSKGIGRFSSDRLGQVVRLQTRHRTEGGSNVHSLVVDWSLFDRDHLRHFEDIELGYSAHSPAFELPEEVADRAHGTVISIENTRREWNRSAILRLKSALAKLINPFGAEVDGFNIAIHAPAEIQQDRLYLTNGKRKDSEPAPNSIVNGPVGNFIFSTLQEKTTFISVRIDTVGEFIESSLIDRGELIYRIREPNEYPLLLHSGFRCQIFFLNQSAKQTFSRRMGVPSVQFGAVFLFRNGFRVFPVGEEGDDWFGMDRRKQQGYARFLGTRDVIGRIDVSGTDDDFHEPSSRDGGLVETPAVVQLKRCFYEHCLKRLERYVVPVTFVDKEDKHSGDISRLLTDSGKARVATAVAKLVDSAGIELIEYSKQLINILDERSTQFEGSLISLRAIAEKTKDADLFQNIESAERRFVELRKSEEAARRQADEERAAKEVALERARVAEYASAKAQEQLLEEKKRNLFLTSISTLDTDTILNLHHQVTIYSVDINQQLENFFVHIAGKEVVRTEDIVNALERIALINKRIMGVSKFATKANFRLASEKIEADVGEYVREYIDGVARDFLHGPMEIKVESDGQLFVQKFKPIDISVVIDNLVANAKKARAGTITFKISHPNKGGLHIDVIDDGKGFSSKIEQLDRVFEKGFTTTDGSGLGLYHVRHVLGQMNGSIDVFHGPNGRGAHFLIRISE
ncbi:ATP-binding protein [uncultured Massilia sp.]|uniref:ATP-binding protein n=1 Tax=uncultured Massilia sp. TaxID=169973 RepID=UPI0025D0AA61|nr:ATP-binding protein [uncultured Massilia sp.]